jgi:hypothetical protein
VKGRNEPVDILEVVNRMDRATQAEKDRIRVYERALDAYFAKRFQEAITICSSIIEGDHAARVLCSRAQAYDEKMPPDGWTGTWAYTEKKG